MFYDKIYILKNKEKEYCIHIIADRDFKNDEKNIFLDVISQNKPYKNSTFFEKNDNDIIIEYGTKPFFITPWSSQIIEILHRVGINHIKRLEKTTRLLNSDFPKIDSLTHTILNDEDIKNKKFYDVNIIILN